MAQFRATIQGTRGEASRLGSKQSGLTVTANGWNAGVRVVAGHRNGVDTFDIYATGGSGYNSGHGLIATMVGNELTFHGRNGSITAEKLAADVFTGELWSEVADQHEDVDA